MKRNKGILIDIWTKIFGGGSSNTGSAG